MSSTRAADGTPVRGLWIDSVVPDEAGQAQLPRDRLFGRTLMEDVTLRTAPSSWPAPRVGDDGWPPCATTAPSPGSGCARCSACQADQGVCAKCYGRSLATGRTIELGGRSASSPPSRSASPARSSPCGPSTGGIAGSDIAGGLPRVVELFEARSPEGARPPGPHLRRGADLRGRRGKGRPVTIVADDGTGTSTSSPACPPRGPGRRRDHRRRGACRGPRDPKEPHRDQGRP